MEMFLEEIIEHFNSFEMLTEAEEYLLDKAIQLKQ